MYLLMLLTGIFIGFIFAVYTCGYVLEREKRYHKKFLMYYQMMDKWMLHMERGENVCRGLKERGIDAVAIYGMGKVYHHLKYELEKEGVTVKYVIDEKDEVLGEQNIYMLKDQLPDIKMVIVTVIDEYDKIREKLKKRMLDSVIISVDDIINGKGDIIDE